MNKVITIIIKASGSVTIFPFFDTRVCSMEAETEGTEGLPFLSSSFLLPLSLRCLCRRENRIQRRREQKKVITRKDYRIMRKPIQRKLSPAS